MRQKYFKVAVTLDETALKKLTALKETLIDKAEENTCTDFSVMLGSYCRFRKGNLLKKIADSVKSIHGFEIVLKEWKAVSDQEIWLIPEENKELKKLLGLFNYHCKAAKIQKPYIKLLKGSAEQIKKASELLFNAFEPFSVNAYALELDRAEPFEQIARETLLPAPQERTVQEVEPVEIDLEKVLLKDLQPSQFYVSEEKLRKTEQWFDPNDLSNFEPISVKEMDGKLVMLDGHTRAVAALNAGLDRVPLVWETEEWDWEMYRRCVHECEQREILSPLDLVPRVISAAEYWERWDAWCDRMQAEVEAARKE